MAGRLRVLCARLFCIACLPNAPTGYCTGALMGECKYTGRHLVLERFHFFLCMPIVKAEKIIRQIFDCDKEGKDKIVN